MPNLLWNLKRFGVGHVLDEHLRKVTEQPACEFVDLREETDRPALNAVLPDNYGMRHRWSH
ncbi:hypothetical protein [Trueperella abortisuis]|uniref:hypothetical protein n=1 Tax=Trueperella abortisuis TaxID=445930 RepID=UPI0028936AE6|nr:hypothetical protein [Trueperella abortisuis]